MSPEINDPSQKAFPEHPFVDAHVHIRDVRALADLAAAHIAAARDAGTRTGAWLFAAAASQEQTGPRIISAGKALYKKGGYGSAFGVAVEDSDDIRREISKLKSEGAGIIKAMASGVVSLAAKDVITPGGFTAGELTLLVQEANAQGLPVMAHANGEGAILAAADAGVRSIEHGFFMTPRALDAMAARGVFWVPTVGALELAMKSGTVSPEMQAHIRELIRSHLAMIAQAQARGVPLAIGTDCVLPDPGYEKAYHAELAYFEKAGLSSSTVTEIACSGGAKLLGM